MGDFEAGTLVLVESPLKYHPSFIKYLTIDVKPAIGQFQVGGLTGAVASQRVTEACKGSFSMVGNHA